MDIMRLLYPRVCPACGKAIPLHRTFCSCSDRSVVRVAPDQTLIAATDPIQLSHLCAPYVYDGVIRQQLLGLKFQHQTKFLKPLAAAMAAQVSAAFPEVMFDCVTFVPMTQDDIRVRSFNQSALLAQRIANLFFIPCSAWIEKTKSTPQQHTLSQAERLQNLESAFQPTQHCIPGSTVILVDDIKTTGTTLFRCCEALRSAGVHDVYCVCAAVARSPSSDF